MSLKPCFFFLILFISCTSTTKSNISKGEDHQVEKKNTLIELDYHLDLRQTFETNKNIIGFNTAFAFKDKLESHPEVVKLTKELKPTVLRFPGGTVASYYHPEGTGYGFKYNEAIELKAMAMLYGWQKKESENYIQNFIRACKNSHEEVKVLAVANLLYGTPEETVKMIKQLKAAGLEVVGVELGNELYFRAYRKHIPDVHDYIKRCKAFSEEIKKFWPELPLAAVAGNVIEWRNPEGTPNNNFIQWNTELAKQDFYDAIVAHIYFGKEGGENQCTKLDKNDIPKIYNCYKNLLSPIKYRQLYKKMDLYQGFFGEDVKIWFTEWNVGKPQKHITNSILHGQFISEVLLSMIELNITNNNAFEFSLLHNYISQGPVMGVIYKNRKKMFNFNDNEEITASTPYYAMRFIGKFLEDNYRFVKSNLSYPNNLDESDIVTMTFVNTKTNAFYTYFINKTSNSFLLNMVNQEVEHVAATEITGNSLYASAGLGAISNFHPTYYSECQYKEKKIDSLEIPPFSFGYLKYDLK